MLSTYYYRLEYNEKKGLLQYDTFSKRKESQFGWETISMVMSLDEIKNFIEIVQQKYPNINSGTDKNYPKAQAIKKMYNDFIGIGEL